MIMHLPENIAIHTRNSIELHWWQILRTRNLQRKFACDETILSTKLPDHRPNFALPHN